MQRIDDRIAVFGLFLVSLTFWGPNVFGSQAYMLDCLALAALAFMTRDWIVIFLGCYYAAWSAIIQVCSSAELMPEGTVIQAVLTLQLIAAGMAVYVLVRFGSTSEKRWMNAICILATFLSIWGLLGFALGKGTVATLGNQNFLAAFLAVAAPCCYGSDRKKWWPCLIPIIGCLLATKTSTAIAVLLIGTGFYFMGWIGAMLAMVPGFLYFLIFKTPASLFERLAAWEDAVIKISNYWYTVLFGVGPGIFWKPDNMLHSEPVYLLWNLGIVGLCLVAAYVARTLYRPIGNRVFFTSFLVVLLDSVGNNIFHTAATATLATVVFALNDRGGDGKGEDRLI